VACGRDEEYLAPNPEDIQKLETFVDGVLWGHLQVNEGEHKFGVHKSLFFYQPALVPNFTYDPTLNWTSWTSWNKEGAETWGVHSTIRTLWQLIGLFIERRATPRGLSSNTNGIGI